MIKAPQRLANPAALQEAEKKKKKKKKANPTLPYCTQHERLQVKEVKSVFESTPAQSSAEFSASRAVLPPVPQCRREFHSDPRELASRLKSVRCKLFCCITQA